MSEDKQETQLPIDQLRQIRIDKVNKLRENGIDPYPQPKIDRENISNILCKEFEVEVKAVGRVLAKRGHGKLSFLDLKDFTGRVQIVLKLDESSSDAFKVLESIDIGDFVSISGKTFETKAGEFSILVDTMELLSKSIRPLPNKLTGFKDKEEKYRQRYADMVTDDKTFNTLVNRSKIVQYFREFFLKNDFFEVNTPTLQEMYGGANAAPFMTHHNSLDADFYLRISPELYLKRLIVGGFEKVFEFTINFRNEGIDRWHNPEFQNIEFYWAYATYEEMMDLTEEMYRYVVTKLTGSQTIVYEGEEVDFSKPFPRITFRDVLIEHTGIDYEEYDDEEKLRSKIAEEGYLKGDDLKTIGYSNLLDMLYKRTTRPKLKGPLFLTDYPAEMIALAKKKSDDPTKIATFQLLIKGEEYVKAYNELNDPLEQRERWEETEKTHEQGQDEAERLDEDYIRALEYGMPPTAGWGLGFERTVALLTDNYTIKDVMYFPTLRPEFKAEIEVEKEVSPVGKNVKPDQTSNGVTLSKEQALELLHKNMENTNLRRHSYGVGFALLGIYDYLKENKLLNDNETTRETWEVFGILHDSDYEITKDDWSKHTLMTLEWLKELGICENDPLYLAEMSHNSKVTGLREPQTQMEWSLECCDELTGFIVACALVKEEKKLDSVTLKTIKKKWGQKAFAKGVEREQIEQCEEKLNIPLDTFISIVLKSMQENSDELGL